MRRGDTWTVSGGKGSAGKLRPVVIVQDDSFDATGSITICTFTTDETEVRLFRLLVEPNPQNGLRSACRLLVDKVTKVPKSKVGDQIGRLDDRDVLRLNTGGHGVPRSGRVAQGKSERRTVSNPSPSYSHTAETGP